MNERVGVIGVPLSAWFMTKQCQFVQQFVQARSQMSAQMGVQTRIWASWVRSMSLVLPSLALALLPWKTAFAGESAPATSKEGSRLEELFIWKVSEELKLPPKQEQAFADTIRDLNEKRRLANEGLSEAIRQLSRASSRAERRKALARHRAALRTYHDVQMEELDRLQRLLGDESLARYLVVKSDLSEKLKALLSSPTASTDKTGSAATLPKLPDSPKLIEEK